MKKVFLMAVGSLLIYSCNNKKEDVVVESDHATEATTHDDHASTDALRLNDKQKWVVNEEMKPFVMKGEELVSTYVDGSNKDYKLLAEQLKSQNEQLIKSCTMDGESHDELHKWLHPHLELTKKLTEETNPETSAVLVNKLQQSYQEYHQYFN